MMTTLSWLLISIVIALLVLGRHWAYRKTHVDIEAAKIRKEIDRLRADIEYYLLAVDLSNTDRAKLAEAGRALILHMVCVRAQRGDGFKLTASDQWTVASILRIWRDSAGYFDGRESDRLRYMFPELHDDVWVHASPPRWVEAIPDQ